MKSDFDRLILRELFEKNRNIHYISHYTSIEAFEGIVQNRSFWMSNINSMNDTDEFIAGISFVKESFKSEARSAGWRPDMLAAILNEYDRLSEQLRDNLYCASFSEFDISRSVPDSLALWGRYGGDYDGACLVLDSKNLLLSREMDDPIFWLPMIYRDRLELERYFNSVFEYLEEEYFCLDCDLGYKWSLDEEQAIEFATLTVRVLLIIAMSHKNISFNDEREIRLVHSPIIHPQHNSSIRLASTEVRAVPRKIAIVDTETYRSSTKVGISIPEILAKVLIGPNGRSNSTLEFAKTILRDAGLQEVPVEYSQIPFRKNRG